MRVRPGEGEPAGAYEVRYRLEGSYRRVGYGFIIAGVAGFLTAFFSGEPWLFVCSGPSAAAGLWIVLNDPREYFVVEPRRRRLRTVRVYGKRVRVRREVNLRDYVRLELARYRSRGKGMRCMVLLFGPEGQVEKLDDRIDDPILAEICAKIAADQGLDFVDRGRIDIDPPPPES